MLLNQSNTEEQQLLYRGYFYRWSVEGMEKQLRVPWKHKKSYDSPVNSLLYIYSDTNISTHQINMWEIIWSALTKSLIYL